MSDDYLSINIKKFVKSILYEDEDEILKFSFDKKSKKFLNKDDLKAVKEKYRERVIFIPY